MKIIIVLMPVMILGFKTYAQDNDSTVRQLEEVTVTAKSPVVIQEADRIVYNLQADPESKVSTVLDMMRKVPNLSVDGDENVLLNGSSSYKIFINGRPSGLVASNPKEALRSIPASTVKSIEVITSPPSRYDAEGLAGIVNIVTLKQRFEGYRTMAHMRERGPVGGLGGGGSFTLKSGRFGINVIAGASAHNNPETGSELRRTTTGKNPSNLFQRTTSRSAGYSIYPGMALSWEFDSLNLVSGEFSRGTNKTEISSATIAILTAGNVKQQYNINNSNRNESNGVESSVNYQHGFKTNKDQVLTLSYQYMNDDNLFSNDIRFSKAANFSNPNYRQLNSQSFTEQAAQVDYTQPVKDLAIEGGIKGIFRTTLSDFQHMIQNAGTGEYETDVSLTNVFRYNQDILAAYNSYTWKLSGWLFKAGIRAEKTFINGGYSQGTAQIRHQYINQLPSVMVNRKLDAKSSLSFSFTRRIQRPSAEELNPFINRSNPNFESNGNPYLQPITSNVFQLSYLLSAKVTFNISLGGMFFNNVFSPFPFYDAASDITITRVENYGKGRVLKANIYFGYPVNTRWNFSMNSDIRHVKLNGFANGNPVKNSGVDVYVYASSGHNFSNNWKASADVMFKKGGLLLPIGRTNGFVASSFSINKNFMSSKLTVSAAVNNPFSKYRVVNEKVIGPDFLQTSVNTVYFRRFTVSINYHFGMLKTEIKKSKKTIENDDMVK